MKTVLHGFNISETNVLWLWRNIEKLNLSKEASSNVQLDNISCSSLSFDTFSDRCTKRSNPQSLSQPYLHSVSANTMRRISRRWRTTKVNLCNEQTNWAHRPVISSSKRPLGWCGSLANKSFSNLMDRVNWCRRPLTLTSASSIADIFSKMDFPSVVSSGSSNSLKLPSETKSHATGLGCLAKLITIVHSLMFTVMHCWSSTKFEKRCPPCSVNRTSLLL